MGKRGMGHSRSGFIAVVSIAFALCLAAVLAVCFACLSAMDRVSEQMQGTLSITLNSEIDAIQGDDGFSGTLYNISDELLGNSALAEIGRLETVEPGDALQAAEAVLADVVDRTSAAGGNRYFYCSNSNYLISVASPSENALASASAPVASVLADLQASSEKRIVGSYENHVAPSEEGPHQVIVRTVAPNVYYVVDSSRFWPSEPPQSFSEFENIHMYYYDRFGNVVQTYGADGLADAFSYDSLGENDSGVVFFRQDGKNYEGVYCTSHSRNLRLAIFFDDDAANAREFAFLVFGAFAVLSLACVVAAYFFVRRAYKPFEVLAGRLAGSVRRAAAAEEGSAGSARGLFRNEGAIIAQAVDSYESQVAKQQNLLSDAWVCRILCGDASESLCEYEDAWLSGLRGRYVVAIVRSDSPADDSAVRAAVEPILAGRFDFRLVSMFGEVVAIVLLGDADECALASALDGLRSGETASGLSSFLSEAHASLGEISACYKEAAAARDYCLSQEKYGIVCRFSEVQELSGNQGSLSEFIQKLCALSDGIAALNGEEAMAAFDEAVGCVGADALESNPSLLGMLCACCAEALRAAVVSRNGDVSAFGAELEKLGAAKKPAQARKVVSRVLKRLAASEDELSSQDQFEALRAATFENCRDSNLSAGALAKRFGISQSWITRLFRRYNDSTFLEYLHGLRLKQAEELLRTTSLTESEIAGRVGYNNTVTMIRAFKKYKGVVPSQLRSDK